MARKRTTDTWGDANRDPRKDAFFSTISQAAQARLGCKTSIGAQAVSAGVGLPFPSLALRYLFQTTTLELSRIMQITGEEGSAKSALAAEVARWHAVYGGGAFIFENENKDAADLRCGIWQWNMQWLARCERIKTYSIEDWQDGMTAYTALCRDNQDERGGIGRTLPIAFVVDSIMGTALRDEIAAVEKEGHATNNHPRAAKVITAYMRTMPNRLQDYPFTVIGTNHLKPGLTPQGLPTANIPGGKSVKFHETFELELSKTMNKDIDKLEYGGLRIKMVLRKNSNGPSRRSIVAELLWWYEDDGQGGLRQQACWDWDTATVELLLSFADVTGKRTIFNRLQEICDIRVKGPKGNREAWSRTLGIPESDPVNFRVLGAALEQRTDLMEPIHRVLGIMRRSPFQPGLDYRQMLAQAAENAKVEAQNLYTPHAMPVGGIGDTDVEPEVAARAEDLEAITGGESDE
jgi:RecA/RadA recombinase